MSNLIYSEYRNIAVLLTELKPELIQEKLTEISKKTKIILVATYELLNCQLPLKTAN